MRRLELSRVRWWHGGLVLAVVAAVFAVFLVPADTPMPSVPEPETPPGRGPLTLVSMGDSSLSGEGTGVYTTDTDGSDGNWCHRSPLATVHQTAVPGVERTVNLACSGSPADHVQLGPVKQWGEPSQAEQLRELLRTHRVTAVVVAVGANDDPKFSRLIPECARAWFRGPPCSGAIAPRWRSTVAAMVPKVVRALGDVRTVFREAGYADDEYQLVVQSYASPIGPGIPEELRTLDGCPFQREDLRWFSGDGVRVLSDALRQAAGEVGARFLDLAGAGAGHEACTGGADPRSEWFSRLSVEWNDLGDTQRASHAVQESFHTNIAGHTQFGRCLTGFLAGDARWASCVPQQDGTLLAVPESAPVGAPRIEPAGGF